MIVVTMVVVVVADIATAGLNDHSSRIPGALPVLSHHLDFHVKKEAHYTHKTKQQEIQQQIVELRQDFAESSFERPSADGSGR